MKVQLRRIGKLERLAAGEKRRRPPTPAEIERLVQKLERDECLSREDLLWLQRHRYVYWRNCWLSMRDGQLVVKGIIGVDWEEI